MAFNRRDHVCAISSTTDELAREAARSTDAWALQLQSVRRSDDERRQP
jgi:hypothetical protein